MADSAHAGVGSEGASFSRVARNAAASAGAASAGAHAMQVAARASAEERTRFRIDMAQSFGGAAPAWCRESHLLPRGQASVATAAICSSLRTALGRTGAHDETVQCHRHQHPREGADSGPTKTNIQVINSKKICRTRAIEVLAAAGLTGRGREPGPRCALDQGRLARAAIQHSYSACRRDKRDIKF
jgi:hypothetical protein